MKSILSLIVLAILSLTFNSCYRIPDRPRPKKPAPPVHNFDSIPSQDQKQIPKQLGQISQQQEEPNIEEISAPTKKPEPQTAIKETPKKQEPIAEKPVEKKSSYVFATPVPGKAGFVYSPYNKKLVDVRDIPSGTLVQDPTYPESEKKFFRVP